MHDKPFRSIRQACFARMRLPSLRQPLGGHQASVRFIVITLVIDALGFGLVVPIIPQLVLHLSGLSVAAASLWVGGLLSMFALMQVFCAPILGGLSDRFGRRPVILFSLLGSGLDYFVLAMAPSVSWCGNTGTESSLMPSPHSASMPIMSGMREIACSLLVQYT